MGTSRRGWGYIIILERSFDVEGPGGSRRAAAAS